MKKWNVCVLFGGMNSEHEVSIRSAEMVLDHMDPEKYHILPVGITPDGNWILYGGSDYARLPNGSWIEHSDNRCAIISPLRGQGLLTFEGDSVVRQQIDVVFPILYGQYSQDGAIQGLLQFAGIPYVGQEKLPAFAAADKTLTKLVLDQAGVQQARWQSVYKKDLHTHIEAVLDALEAAFSYPMVIKPSCACLTLEDTRAVDRGDLEAKLIHAAQYHDKILVEEAIMGRLISVAVMGNDNPMASGCGELATDATGATVDCQSSNSAQISELVAEQVREAAVKVYTTIGCRSLSLLEFYVTYDEERVIFNGIDTMPTFTPGSVYPKLFDDSGVSFDQLIDELLRLAMEA